MSNEFEVAYGTELITLRLDPRRMVFDLSPADVPAAADPAAEVRRALDEPIGAAPLREQVTAGQKVVVIGDDATRLTPTDTIIPLVLDELNAGGVADEDILLMIATGTHRAMTDQEIAVKYTPAVSERVRIVNHDCLDEANLVSCGGTGRGTDIWVNRTVLEASVRVGVGNIVPHHPTGWSGGAKIILPGVASRATTGQMHLLGATEQQLGKIDTPCRREMEDFAASVGLEFIVNTVLDRRGKLVRASAGQFVAAHRDGVGWAQRVFGAEFAEQADITISSCHPIDFDLFQADKGLFSAARCTKEGGEIMLLSPCHEGVSATHGHEAVQLGSLDDEELWRLVAAGRGHDPLSIAEALYFNTIKKSFKVTLVTEGISQDQARQMGFGRLAPAELADYLSRRLSEDARPTVGILRNSVETLPMQTSRGD